MRAPGFLVRWRERRDRVEREAGFLLTFLGDMAYDEARGRARRCREERDRQGDRLWSWVAVAIARRTGREVGVKVADRYEREATSERRARARHESEVGVRTGAILSALAEIARGRHVATELHSVSAHLRNAEALVPRDAEVAAAGAEVARAAAQLAGAMERSVEDLDRGLYPPGLEAAGQAVERWRAALLKGARR